MNEKFTQRKYYLDYLRIFASVAIILLHVTAMSITSVELTSTEWNIFNIYSSITRWGVPVFVMISGTLFLPREIPIKILYKKYISRMAISYVVWSAFYAIVDPIGHLIFTEGYQLNIVEIIGSFISGAIHLWFLPMIIGLYMCIPFIKQITHSDKLTKYFLFLSIIFCVIKTHLNLITRHLLSGNIQTIFEKINIVFGNFNINLVLGFLAYFVWGFFLSKTEIRKKHRTIIYILGVLGLVLTILLTSLASKNAGEFTEAFYASTSLNVFLISISIFVWFKYNVKGTEFLNKIITTLSKYSFGAYLIHIFVLQAITALDVHDRISYPLLSVPIVTILIALISYLISMILNKIPVIKKYMV